MRLTSPSLFSAIFLASRVAQADIIADAGKVFGQVTSAGGAAASCVAGLDILTAVTNIPTATGELQSFLVTHTSKQALENYCSLATQVPAPLSSSYSVYTASLSSWYASVSSELNAKKSACPVLSTVTLPVLPFCTTGLNGTNSTAARQSAASRRAPGDFTLAFGMVVAAGFVGALAVVL